jgi:hypothetical protein
MTPQSLAQVPDISPFERVTRETVEELQFLLKVAARPTAELARDWYQGLVTSLEGSRIEEEGRQVWQGMGGGR